MKYLRGKGYEIDIRVPGLGRLKRNSGTAHLKTFQQIQAMIGHLIQTGRSDILSQIKEGKLTFLEVYNEWRQHKLENVPSADDLKPLGPALLTWIENHSVADRTRSDYRFRIKQFLATVPKDARISGLPGYVKSFKPKCRETKVNFNRVRAIMMSFAHSYSGKNTPLWNGVVGVDPYPIKKARPNNPLTVPQLYEVIGKCRKDIGPIVETLALTGMMPSEFWGDWEVVDNTIVIRGTKTEYRERTIPKLCEPANLMVLGYKATWRNFHKMFPTLTLYDLRRTYANIMEAAGIPRARRKQYMGHSSGDITDLYETHEVAQYLEQDRKTLLGYIEREKRKQKNPIASQFFD